MGSLCAKPARPAGVELGNAPSPSRRGSISTETGSSAQGENAAGQGTPPPAGSAAKQLAASEAGPGSDLLDRMPTATIAAVSSAVDAWNNQKDRAGTGGNTVASLLSSVTAAVPGFAQTLGALGEHAPLVGVIFSVLKVAGDRVAKTSTTRAQYEELFHAVITTTRLVTQAESRISDATVKSALAIYWAQLDAFAQLLVEFRGANYTKRLWSQGKHQGQLDAIRRRIEDARADLGNVAELVNVRQGEEIQAGVKDIQTTLSGIADGVMQINTVSGQLVQKTVDLESRVTNLEDVRAASQTWSIVCLVTSFVGRSAELARLAELLQPAPARGPATRIVISGMGGTGKSTLACFAAQQHNARFTSGWVVNGSTEAAVLADLATMASELGLGDVKPEQLASAVTRKLSEPGQQGWLLLVDNVDDSDFKPQLLKLLPTVGGCVVVTSRLAHWVGGWTVLPLSVLTRAEAIRLLSDAVQEADASALEEVATMLSGLPLALANARAYVECTDITWPAYLVKLKAQSIQLVSTNVVEIQAVLPSLQLSLNAVLAKDGNVQALLELLQVLHPDSIPRSLLTDCLVSADGGADADELLSLLAKFSIIERTKTTVSTHRLMQAAMRTVAPCSLAVLEALVKVIRETVLKKNQQDFSLMRQLLVQLEELLPLLEQQAPGSLPLASAWYAVGMIQLFSLGNKIPAYDAYQKALAIQQAVLGEQHVDVAETLRQLSATSLDAQERKALCEKALTIYVQLYGRDHVEVATTLVHLSIAYMALGDYAQQKALLEEALPIMERYYGPGHPEVARTLVNLGNAVGDLGDYTKQKALLKRALLIEEQHYGPDHPQVAITLGNLGNAYSALGDAAQQKALLQRALAIEERHYGPDHPEVAISLVNLGDAYYALGDAAQQKALLERALPILERHHGLDHPYYAEALTGLGDAYRGLGEATKSKESLERALTIKERYYGPNHPEVALTLFSLGITCQVLGDPPAARRHLERCLSIRQKAFGDDHDKTRQAAKQLQDP